MTISGIASAAIAIPASAAGLCAHAATFLPPPSGPGWYAVLYAMINAIGGNYGNARNR